MKKTLTLSATFAALLITGLATEASARPGQRYPAYRRPQTTIRTPHTVRVTAPAARVSYRPAPVRHVRRPLPAPRIVVVHRRPHVRRFHPYDFNRDGVVTRRELRRAMFLKQQMARRVARY